MRSPKVWLISLLLSSALCLADQRGDYLLTVAGCIACHTAEGDGAEALAGGRAMTTPFGTLYSPNITFSENGIGGWSLQEFEQALRHGKRPDGRYYYPAFPFTSYRHLADDDVKALFDALRQRPIANTHNREPDLGFPFNQRGLLSVWRSLHFVEPTLPVLMPEQSDAVAYGRYLTQAVAHCAECHSPRDAIGGFQPRAYLAGATLPSGHRAPDLRPHAKALGAWSEEDIADYLKTGRSDYTRKARDEMLEFIECCSKAMTESDRLAIAHYLQQLPKPRVQVRRGPRSHPATIR